MGAGESFTRTPMVDFGFDQYVEWFEFAKLKRSESGVLEVRLHRQGRRLDDWSGDALAELGLLFGVIGSDPSNRVVVLTGTGDYFIKASQVDVEANSPIPSTGWAIADRWSRRLRRNLLNIEVPVIAAVNGPCEVLSEIVIMSDFILMTSGSWLADARHYSVDCVPGDGALLAWTLVLGANHARRFVLEAERMSAEEAHDRKIINKVVDDSDQLESRALEMAERLARKPQQVLSYSRMLAVRPFRQAFELNGALGIAYQGLAASDYWPAGPAKGPASHQ